MLLSNQSITGWLFPRKRSFSWNKREKANFHSEWPLRVLLHSKAAPGPIDEMRAVKYPQFNLVFCSTSQNCSLDAWVVTLFADILMGKGWWALSCSGHNNNSLWSKTDAKLVILFFLPGPVCGCVYPLMVSYFTTFVLYQMVLESRVLFYDRRFLLQCHLKCFRTCQCQRGSIYLSLSPIPQWIGWKFQFEMPV